MIEKIDSKENNNRILSKRPCLWHRNVYFKHNVRLNRATILIGYCLQTRIKFENRHPVISHNDRFLTRLSGSFLCSGIDHDVPHTPLTRFHFRKKNTEDCSLGNWVATNICG